MSHSAVAGKRSHRSTPEGRGRPPILKKGQAEMSACIYSDKYVQFWLLHSTYIIDGQRCITSNFFSKVQLVLFLRMTSRRVTLNWYLTVFCVMHHWPSTFCNTQRRNFCVFYKLLREFFMWRRHSVRKSMKRSHFSTFIIWISRQNSASETFNQLKTHCYKMYFWCHFWRENSHEIIFE